MLSAPIAPIALDPAAAFDTPDGLRDPTAPKEVAQWPAPTGGASIDQVGPSAATTTIPPARRPDGAFVPDTPVRNGHEPPLDGTPGAVPAPLRPTPLATDRSRLAGSAWAIARGGGNGTLLGGQLGASQAGMRLTYALGEARRIALSARFATPLRGTGKEAAVGFDWQPTRMPLHLLAEQRFSLDGGHGGPTLLVIGGLNPTPVVAGFRLEAYAQAGAIARRSSEGGVEAFGDGAARLTHLIATLGAAKLDAGAGSWGAAQRGARRLDVGPTLGLVVPVGKKALRLTLDWRQRIAGEARPESGPALSVGTDF